MKRIICAGFSSRAACRIAASRATALLGAAALLGLACAEIAAAGAPTTTLADQPVFSGADVPGNMALVLSVEYPTANSVANLNDYLDSSTYLGYFDPLKCYTYTYVFNSAANDGSSSYFQPAGAATGTSKHQCSGKWSGNFMNWATMQTIDPFRWALSGGYRSTDTTTTTILEKAWGSGQGGTANFPDRGTAPAAGSGNDLPNAMVALVTPFNWTSFNFRIEGNGNRMVFANTGNNYQNSGQQTDLTTLTGLGSSTAYQVYVRIKVCDAGTSSGTAGLEANCVKYGSNYKPEGLLQQYSNQIKFSAFGYLNGDGATREGGVLRETMGFIGPTYPQPLSSTVVTNTRSEWDATTGIMNTNPDTSLASASGVSYSGVMNYLNKFGETSKSYMQNDNVSELYYAAIRYFENLGNVSQWTNAASTAELDGFPAATSWTDPISYSCQKNFILGIGDDHTHVDYDVGTGTAPSNVTVATGSRAKPSAVSSDTLNQAAAWTANLQGLEGITQSPWWSLGAGQATYYIAGLAYGAHVLDIRSDLTGTQTIATYWMDVMEYQRAENLNPYYLAAKYGGFAVPQNYSMSNTTALPQGEWDTTGNTINMNGNTQLQPDNYFLAGNASQMVTSLKSAFTNIANAIKAFTTSFSFAAPTIASAGTASFATQYDPSGWTGVITASTLTIASDGTPSTTPLWVTSSTLQTQLAGTGYDTGRRVVTWNGSSGAAFRVGNLTASQLASLSPSYSASTTTTQYLNYLRGDQTNEVGSTASGSTKSLRARKLLLGDIVDAKLTPVGTPVMNYSESLNPGYTAFKTLWASRPTVVYAAANDGMLHAFLGSNGTEQFAYVPSAVFQGPNGTPQVDGLAQLGNPNYVHHYYVDATPLAFDIDFNNAGGSFSATTDWHTLLIGGLGKGGKSYYAIDVTDPASMNTESAAAGKVKWEFTDSTMGYSYGAPIVVKTTKYGWVVALTSGYDNSDGYGYLYLVNPRTGALLEKIATPIASSGLTQASAYVMDYSDFTADSVYAGDLNGQLWRFDLRGTRGSTTPQPAPTQLASLTDSSGHPQPVTSAPLIEIYPITRKRYVLVGTGQLLSALDVSSAAVQSFYAIVDGTSGTFSTVSTPITRSNLQAVSDVTVGVSLAAAPQGWYTDLGLTSGVGWRVVSNPVAYNGIVAFTTLLSQGDACSPSGQSRVYAIDYGTGLSVLLPTTAGSTTPPAYIASTSAIDDLRIVSSTSGSGSSTSTGNPELIAGKADGGIGQISAKLKGTIATRLLNWREIPTAE
jgi:type IV pilus assembly protein PilY1